MHLSIPQVFHRERWPRPTRSTLVLGGVMAALVVSTHWLTINISPSVPLGLYRLSTVPWPLRRGTLVLVPLPQVMAPWHPWWIPLLKPVAAIAGDRVCVEEGTLWVERQRWDLETRSLGRVLREAQGRVLPQIVGCMTIPDGEVFLATDAPRSMDSRYFGSVPIRSLTAQAVPVWTWGER